MKMCVIVPRFTLSGVPLAQLRFAEALARRGYEVDFLIGAINQGFGLPKIEGVNVTVLHCASVRAMFSRIVSYLLQNKVDVVFSAEDHLNVVVLLASIFSKSRAKISCSSRVTPYDTYSTKQINVTGQSKLPGTVIKRLLLKWFFRAVMWRADALTCVSADMAAQYRAVFPKSRHVHAYNIVDKEQSRGKISEPVDLDWFMHADRPVVVAAGQLEPWKGFADLIRAIGEVSKKRDVRLVIFGEGSQRSHLEDLITNLGLRDVVMLPGNVSNPLKYFSRARVFALSSYVEGMPNALVEAMMCGCTPVATDCPTGPRELLANGKFGYLVPVGDPIAIASGTEQALDLPISEDRLTEALRPFQEKAVIARHFDLLGLNEWFESVPSNRESP